MFTNQFIITKFVNIKTLKEKLNFLDERHYT